MAFGIRPGTDDFGTAGKCHQGPRHRDPRHTVDVAVQNVAVTHAAAAIFIWAALGANALTFDCRDNEPKSGACRQ